MRKIKLILFFTAVILSISACTQSEKSSDTAAGRKELTNDENKDYGYYFELTPTKSISQNIISPEICPSFNLIE